MPTLSLPRRELWILGPKRDLLFFILTPLLIVPFFRLLPHGQSPQTIALYILGIGGFGHHLPGFIRAYSDRGLFAQHRLSFTLIPLLLVLACSAYSYLNLNALTFLTVAWGTWHGAMQVNGFMRIYDSKVKSFRPATARLDRLMCVAWFGIAILQSPEKQFSLAALFYGSGGFLIPPAGFEILRWIWGAFTLGTTFFFLANILRQWKTGSPPSPAKLLIMAASFGFWWFCTVSLRNLLLGVLMWEVFHDIQYNVLVWHFQRHRVAGKGPTGAAEKFLFRSGWGRLGLYAGLIVAYGYLGIATSFASVQLPEDVVAGSGLAQWLVRISLASALLHFYYDGFIWRVREAGIRRDLGVPEGETDLPAAKPMRRGLRPVYLWLLFIIPAVYMGINQHRGSLPDFPSQMVNLAEAIPGNWKADFLSGTYFKGQGDFATAESHYRRAVAARPDFATGHLFLGDILYKQGNLPEAIEEYRQSVDLEPDNLDGLRNLANLYLNSGQPSLAAERFLSALALDADNPDLNFGMATALLRQNKLQDAEPYVRKTLQLSPGHSGALNYLGMIRDVGGDAVAALEYYRQALAADSGNASAKENLAALLAKQARPKP